jgi:hypothetical protein
MFTLRERHITLTGNETLYGIIELWRGYDVESLENESAATGACGCLTCMNAVKLGRYMHALSVAQRCTEEIEIYVKSRASAHARVSR